MSCRLEEAGLPASMALPLQLDYAALCDEVGARGDFDRLSGANLGASTAAVHDLGLAEMMVSVGLWLPFALRTHYYAKVECLTILHG
jgi:hypothetical protein